MGRSNTFRYISFTDRIARINVELIRTGRSLKANPDVDNETFFGEEIEKLQDLDYTQDFTKLLEALPPDVGHFSQLVFCKKEIAAALLESFETSRVVCVGSLLKLTVALCRDLHSDFHPFFWRFFDQLIRLITVHSQDAELLEKLFTCLAFLVKFMWKELLGEQERCLEKFLPLFSHRRVFVRRFSSEAFAFLCRKIKSHRDFYALCLRHCHSDELVQGLAELIFQTVKGVKKQLHSCADEIIPVLLGFLDSESINNKAMYQILYSVSERLHKHIDPMFAGILLSALLDHLRYLENGTKASPINWTCSLLASWAQYKNGVFICDNTVTAGEIAQALNLLHDNFISEETLLLSRRLLETSGFDLDCEIKSAIIKKILFSKYGSTLVKITFVENIMFQAGMLDSEMENLKRFMVENCFATPDLSRRSLLFLVRLVETECNLPPDGNGLPELKRVDLDFSSTCMPACSQRRNLRTSKSIISETIKPHEKYFNDLNESLPRAVIELLTKDDTDGFSDLLCYVRLRPHILPRISGSGNKQSKTESDLFYESLKAVTDEEQVYHMPLKHRLLLLKMLQLLVVNHCLENSLDPLSTEGHFDKILSISVTSELASDYLKFLDYYLHVETTKNPGLINAKILERVYWAVQVHLLSPFHEIRRLALVILNRFSSLTPEAVVNDEKLQLFPLMLACENLPLDLTSHREKLRLYRKFTWSEYQYIRLEDPLFAFTGLRYLIGCLYQNFSLLWDPLIDIIETHMKGLSKDNSEEFFRHIDEILSLCKDRAVKHIFNESLACNSAQHEQPSPCASNSDFWLKSGSIALELDRPDHVNFRILVLKSLSRCIGVVEPHNRLITKYFLEMIDEEYKHPQLQTAAIQDLTKDDGLSIGEVKDIAAVDEDDKLDESYLADTGESTSKLAKANKPSTVDDNLEESCLEDSSGDDEDEEDSKSEVKAERRPTQKRPVAGARERMTAKMVRNSRKQAQTGVIRSLLAYLELYSKFRNPQALWKEPKLMAFYKELLLSSNLGLQTAAFRCVFAYRQSWLTPYRENFDRLLDEKTFSDELVLFGLNADSCAIDPGHRPQILDLLLRFLYGRLMMKPKSGGVVRHQIIRFLCGCRQEELSQFLDLIFGVLKPYTGTRLVAGQILEDINKNFVASRCIPLKRLLGLMHMLALLIRHVGNLIVDSQPTMLRAIIVCGGIYKAIMGQDVSPKHRTSLKTLRKLLFARLQQFTTHFDSYKYSQEEIQAIFEAIVWPECSQIHRFVSGQDSTVNPAPVILMFLSWSENPRLFELFGFRGKASVIATESNPGNEVGQPVDPLGSVVQLLKPTINLNLGQKESLLRLVQNLLTIADLDADDDCRIGVDLKHLETGKLEDVNLGTKLLLPYSGVILENIKQRLSGQGKKKSPSSRDLTILQRIAEHCDDSTQADSLVTMLLDMLIRDIIKQEAVHVKAISTVGLLIPSCKTAYSFIRPIAKLFGKFSSRFARDALCDTLKSLARVNDCISNVAGDIAKMNSWDPKRVDEPDYDTRLGVMSEIAKNLTAKSEENGSTNRVKEVPGMNADEAELILHNLAFFVKKSTDLSLRDTSSYTLQLLIRHLPAITKIEESRKLFNELNSHIRQGLRSETEGIRLEFISILRVAVLTFPNYPRYLGMANLSSVDPDLDFFENMKHIQLHRRARAVMRLVNQVSGRSTSEAHNKMALGKQKHSPTKAVEKSVESCTTTTTPSTNDESKSAGKINFPMDVMTSFLIPIITPYILDDLYVKHTNLVHEAVNVLGEIAQRLDWNHYSPLLQFYMNKLQKEPERQKVLIKALVKILDAFHFSLDPKRSVSAHQNEPIPENRGNADNSAGAVESLENHEDTAGVNDEDAAEVVGGDVQLEPFSGKIYTVVKTQLLPKLQQAITKKLSGDSMHRKSQSTAQAAADDVDFESLRAPIALALVKLLQKMPYYLLKQNLPSIFAKVCQLLKSRSFDVRETTRKTLINIIETLGVTSLSPVINEMQSLLSRGYQLHVMNHSVFFLLDRLSSSLSFQNSDYDSIVTKILQIAQNDLFGAVAEEKTVEEVRRHVPEARSNKIYRTFTILGSRVTAKGFQLILEKLVEWLDSEQRHKAVKMVTKLCKSLTEGIVQTTLMDSSSVLIILHSVMTENLEMIKDLKTGGRSETGDQNKLAAKPDTYLIPAEPGRAGPQPVTSKKSSRHTIVEFSFEVLHGMLKHGKLNRENPQHLAMLDPFVNFIISALNSKQPWITCLALRCLNLMIHFDLPSLTVKSRELFEQGFVLLNHYGGLGVALRRDSSDLLIILFKVLTSMIRDSRHGKLNEKQMQVLLQFVEQDLYDSNRQATAFSLLKVMVKQRIDCPEMHDLMNKVGELMIQSPANHIRSQSRQVFLIYLLEYKLGKQMGRRIEFVLAQLDYGEEDGRLSCLEMLLAIFSHFPQNLLDKYATLAFLQLALRLVNDESAKCRLGVTGVLRGLIEKISLQQKEELYGITLKFHMDLAKIIQCRLAMLLFAIFIDVEKESFEKRISSVVKIFNDGIEHCLRTNEDSKEGVEHKNQAELDNYLYQVLTTVLRLISVCPTVARSARWAELSNKLFENVQSCLIYPFNLVRLQSARLMGCLFASYEPSELTNKNADKDGTTMVIRSQEYLLRHTKDTMQQLWECFCHQLRTPVLQEELSDQVVKNLVYLAKVVSLRTGHDGASGIESGNSSPSQSSSERRETNLHIKGTGELIANGGEVNDDDEDDVILEMSAGKWQDGDLTIEKVAHGMARIARFEVIRFPKEFQKRSAVIKWIGAIALELPKEIVSQILPDLITVVQREIVVDNQIESIKTLALEVADLLKQTVGVETYGIHSSRFQQGLRVKRETRKRERAVEVVTDPQKAAKRRLRKQKTKSESKKRKMLLENPLKRRRQNKNDDHGV